MKKIMLLLFFFTAFSALAQKEANNWYFGLNAGIRFLDDGSVQALTGSQINTNEGCSSISDADGNLLFYTDGRTVWDRNHVIMPNANYTNGISSPNTGLLGDPSSTQSGIIVPKKNDPNIYYIFTVDEPHHNNAAVYPARFLDTYDEGVSGYTADDGYNNGLNYSIVDLSVTGSNGSVGDVTTRNVHLYTYNPAIIDEAKYKCSEKITAVKDTNGTGFWVVTHFIDKFYSFFVDQNGVNETPVVTQITPYVPTSGYRRNSIGCIKASPDGTHLAIAHQQLGTLTGQSENNGCVYLYNFNTSTGVVSNPLAVVNNVTAYGIEFSPQASKLYASFGTQVRQYDMLSSDIPASGITVASGGTASTMQLGPNGKIYKARVNGTSLDVINDPDADGTLCDYVSFAVGLSPGASSVFGLPPFITSLLSIDATVSSTCFGNATQFGLSVNLAFDSVSWNFGDGTPPSAQVAPVHTYAATGTYNATAAVTRNGDTETITKEVIIYAIPVANTPPALTQCDPDGDGFVSFNLSANTAAILGTQSAATYTVRYFSSQQDANTNTSPLSNTAYTNTANPQTIYARIQNNGNSNCYAVVPFVLNVSLMPTIAASSISVCDDATDGNAANGRATFNLANVTTQIVPGTGYTTTYYATQANANAEASPLPLFCILA